MIEKIVIPNGYVIQDKGIDPITGLQSYMRLMKGVLEIDLSNLQIRVPYEEWKVSKDGKIYEKYFETKKYILVDIPSNNFLPYTQWISQLSPTVIPAITSTIASIPLNSDNNFVIPI